MASPSLPKKNQPEPSGVRRDRAARAFVTLPVAVAPARTEDTPLGEPEPVISKSVQTMMEQLIGAPLDMNLSAGSGPVSLTQDDGEQPTARFRTRVEHTVDARPTLPFTYSELSSKLREAKDRTWPLNGDG